MTFFRFQITNLLAVLIVSTLFAQPVIRKTINLNWTFNYFPDGAEEKDCFQLDFNDAQWPVIALPHTWSTYETTGNIHPFIEFPSERDDPYWWTGRGWYRKKVIIEKINRDKKIFIEFDGVQKYSQFWVNGHYVGEHQGGFNSFSFDITPFVEFDKENVLVMSVSNRRDDPLKIPPMTAGNWNLYGGIYRDVRLVVKDKLFCPFQGSFEHEGGTYITTPQVSAESATVHIKTFVQNDYKASKTCRVVNTILDPEGKVVLHQQTSQILDPGQLVALVQDGFKVIDPLLWSPDSPVLYKVITQIYNGEKLVDELSNPLGFRWFKWDYKNNRLILNGKRIHIHGTNLHQEYPWLGDAMPKWLQLKDLHDIKYGLNHNFIRGAHYTHDNVFYDFCDQHGILVAEEVPNIKSIDFSETVQEQNVREMIRRDRNHPCIIFWSMGNETNDAADSRWAWEEDTTRILHARHVNGPSAGEFVTHTHEQMDMENLLRCTIRGWYNADVKGFEPKANQHTGHEEWQHLHARVDGGSQRGRIDMGNGAMWIYADHGADREYVNAPLKHVNPKGWVDLYRFPKYLYYLWQAQYLDEPMVFIHPHFWREQFLGEEKDIQVDSNCERVELFVDGRQIGILFPRKERFNTVTFEDVPIQRGVLTAKGFLNGKYVEWRLPMAGKATALNLSASHARIQASLASIAVITADIHDRDGNHIYGANPTLEWSVNGPATLVGPERYESDRDKFEDFEGTMYIDVPVKNLIRSTGMPGKIRVRVSAEGLEPAQIEIDAVESKSQTVGGIVESLLDPVGRQSVVRPEKRSVVKTVKQEIKETLFDLQLPGSSHKDFEKCIADTLASRNKRVSIQSIEFRALTKKLGSVLTANRGELVADDYNFIIQQYNRCRAITRVLEGLAYSSELKKEIVQDLSRRVIELGEQVDIDREIQAIIAR